ncbi:hypothetical protein EC957_011542 [Mortierella hygrophila]|uniref:Uncharacterized protein n=1 Tax=Mortierella hygrophila TaxID=979708 RepID=A0A9P6K3U8_9FUNG|nr:hypothetical protein EC957_011542 [Mortierella hygrophila]
MFNWIKSPTLPDTIETQAFRSISGGPIFRINTLNDRTHRMKLVPWEDILELFPKAIYLRDANGIVMPARDNSSKRISPKSIKLQADVVLEVVSTHDEPPTSARPEIITSTTEVDSVIQPMAATGITGGRTSTSSVPRGSTDLDLTRSAPSARSSIRASSESVHAHTYTPKQSPESARNQAQGATPRPPIPAAITSHKDEDEDDWSPFQANSAATFPAPQTFTIPGPSTLTHTRQQAPLLTTHIDEGKGLGKHGIMTPTDILRQEIVHRLEFLAAEQEERLNLILTACRNRPSR